MAHLAEFHLVASRRSRSPSRSSTLVPSMSGLLAAKPLHHEGRDKIEFVTPEVIVDHQQPMSEKQTTNLRNAVGIVAPSAALAALAVFSLPAASHAMSMVDVASIAGGAQASYSAWMESLTDSGFYQAFSLVFLSEIGDKTFFVAALLAGKLSRLISFIGSLGALAVMTVISVVIGQVFHAVPSEIANGVPLDDVAATIAFTYFGIKILSEAFETPDEGKSAMDEEFEEAEEVVEENDSILNSSAG